MSLPESFSAYFTTESAVNHSTTTPDKHPELDRANLITTTIGGGLSIIGVIFIVFSYFKLLKFRVGGTTAQTILMYISVGMILFYSHRDTMVCLCA